MPAWDEGPWPEPVPSEERCPACRGARTLWDTRSGAWDDCLCCLGTGQRPGLPKMRIADGDVELTIIDDDGSPD